MLGRVCGVCVGACVVCVCVGGRGCGRKCVSFAPLYYPDTLVNPDTCLGSLKGQIVIFDSFFLQKIFLFLAIKATLVHSLMVEKIT